MRDNGAVLHGWVGEGRRLAPREHSGCVGLSGTGASVPSHHAGTSVLAIPCAWHAWTVGSAAVPVRALRVFMHACMHAMCYARLALRVRDLARVEGLVVGQVRWGVAVVWQRRSDAWPAGRVSMKDGVLRACMHAVCPTRGFNACEISHAWWGVCGAWHKQGCWACKPCAKHNFLTAGMLRNCRPMCRACVSLRVRDLSRVGGVGGERQASRERFPCVSTRARSLTRTVCACFAMTRMLGMLAVCHSPHVACVART